ncbi:MAG: phosphohydrolase, partial [Planctomycetota bacterium]
LEQRTGRAFPERLRWLLEHIILSHHGQYEFGSPKLPATPEAIAVHHLDNLDAKVTMFLNEIDKEPSNGNWTGFIRSLNTKVFRPNVAGGPTEPASEDPAPAPSVVP